MSSRILFLDASAGVSGDMFVGALLDVGAELDVVRRHLQCLGINGLEVRAARVRRQGLMGTKFDVMDATTGRHLDTVPEGGYRENHPHRGLGDIRRLLRGSELPPPIARDALAVFELLGRAEARVHGVDPDQVHFHEVGALDAIADIVAAASVFHQLRIDEAWCSPVHVGCGTVRCAHGVLPVPAPATAEILKGVPVYSDGIRGELCTPTGAALVRYFCSGFRAIPPMVVESIGYGAGTKEFGIPNLLRAMVGAVADEGTPRESPAAS